ncbi:MAG: outer membrane lipoprotein carrier protein LolA [Truepera sp.]|nr:outer membrane lipoprotein carrier protein LolA [Truepera sp.]
MIKLLWTISLALLSFGLAQDLTADEVLAQLTASAQSLEDASLLVSGRMIDPAGSEMALELRVYLIPALELVRLEFLQPTALADNFMVLDREIVYNYLFVTNQVMIHSAGDPDALGALFPDANAVGPLALSFDLSRLFDGWEASLIGYGPSPEGEVYLLRFSNSDPLAEISHVNAQVVAERWVPYRLEFVASDGQVIAELFFTDLVRDQGLSPDDLRYLPPDAEIIDER